MIAEEMRRAFDAKGHQISVHHIDDVKSKDLPSADLFIFGSPTRMGGPIGSMKKFLKKAPMASGAKYAIFATHADEVPDKKTGRVPTEEELNHRRRTITDLDNILKGKGLVKVTDKVFTVRPDTMKGPLKDGWQNKVEQFVNDILSRS